jgi:hypothetical protein
MDCYIDINVSETLAAFIFKVIQELRYNPSSFLRDNVVVASQTENCRAYPHANINDSKHQSAS